MAAVKKIIKNKWVISIALNIIALFVILLFFEITPKNDDYNMAQILYGTYADGAYSEYILYINPIIGLINKWLLQIFPNVSWYYVFQIILMVAAFSFILRIELNRLSTKFALIYWALMIPLCGYYFYSLFTFTKTAGLLMVAGLLCLLYAIGKNGNQKILFYISGFVFMTFGVLYRSGLFNMVLVCFLPAVVLEVKSLWINKKELCKTIIKFAIVVVALFIIYDSSSRVRSTMLADTEWSDFDSYNSIRSSVMDYPLLDYEENKDLYEEYGITESELLMWITYGNTSDMSVDDYRVLQQFRASSEERGVSSRTFFNTLFSQLCSNMLFYVLIIFLILLILSKNKNKWWVFICVVGVLVTCIFVMYFRGRLQDQTNGAVLMACALQLMYYAEGLPDRKYGSYFLSGLVYLFAILYNYASLSTSSYNLGNGGEAVTSYREFMADNYKNMSLLSEDKEHFYLMGTDEYDHIFQCFPALTVMPKQFYSNVARASTTISHPLRAETMENYGLYVPYKDMVDNLDMFYCFTDYTEYQLEDIVKYIYDKYGIECEPVLLKEAEKWELYRFCSHDLILEDIDYIDDTSDITYQIDIDADFDELDISGYAYIEGEDSFAQNIYVELEDPETDEEYYYYTLQTENESLRNEDKYNGKYSDFSASIDLQESGLREYLIYVILEINNNYYKIAVG